MFSVWLWTDVERISKRKSDDLFFHGEVEIWNTNYDWVRSQNTMSQWREFFFFFFVALMKNWLYPCPIWFNSYIDFFSFTTKLRCSFRCNSGTMKNLHRDPRSWIIYTALLKEENGVNCCTGSAWIISSRLEHFLYIKTKKCCVIPRERIRVKFFDFRSSRKSSVRKIIFTYESKSNVCE